MPPVQLTRGERASLSKFLERPLQPGEIPADHEEKFINYDLVRKRVLLMHITELGQMELLRQRFRGMRALMRSDEPMPMQRPLLLGR